jgi:hypothetical protein
MYTPMYIVSSSSRDQVQDISQATMAVLMKPPIAAERGLIAVRNCALHNLTESAFQPAMERFG